jgi:hypothetical protein
LSSLALGFSAARPDSIAFSGLRIAWEFVTQGCAGPGLYSVAAMRQQTAGFMVG